MKNTSNPLYMRIIAYIGFATGITIGIALGWHHLQEPVSPPLAPTIHQHQTIHAPAPISTKNHNNVIITLGQTNNY